MEQIIKSLTPLLTVNRGKISAPEFAAHAARKVYQRDTKDFNRLAEVVFSDSEIHRPDDGNDYKTYVIGSKYREQLPFFGGSFLALFVLKGDSEVMAVASAWKRLFAADRYFETDWDYESDLFGKILSEEQLEQVFEYLFRNEKLLTPVFSPDSDNR